MSSGGSYFLTVRGKGVRRLKAVIWFFGLAGAIAYPGTLWIRQYPAKGTNQPWILQYEGFYTGKYYRLLVIRGTWPERITMDQEVVRHE